MKEKKCVILILVFLLLSSIVFTQDSLIPKGKNLMSAGDRLGGDSPLTPFFSWSGNGEVNVFTSVLGGVDNPADNIFIENIPAGATIIQAYFCVTSWQDEETESSAVFNGNDLPQIPANTIDPDGSSYFLSYYRWDVTEYIDGNGDYQYSTFDISQCYLSFLIVLFEELSLPDATVMINDGSESLQNAASTTYFESPMAAEDGDLLVLTQASDPSDGPTEYLAFNGTTVLGPADIFNANLGNFADLNLLSNVTILEGENSMTVNTGEDWFGIHYAVLSSGEINISVDDSEISNVFDLKQNFPNPFNSTTTISFNPISGKTADTKFLIYNVKGQKIRTFSNLQMNKSTNQQIFWDGKDDHGRTVMPGLYFYKLSNGIEARKMTFIK